MLGEPQLYVVLAGVAVVHLLVLAYAALRGPPRPTRRPDDGERGDVVVCPDCEAENEPGYRYCRGCAGELPGAGPDTRRPRPVGDGDVL